jgi:DnaJ-class molecular chaperone
MAKRDYYQVLGVDRSATADEIRKAHRKLARQYHPDMNKSADAAKKFNEIQEAYDTLSDEKKKKAYDQYGHAAESAASAGGTGRGAHYTWSNVGGGGGRPDIDAEELGSMFDAFFGGRNPDMGGMGGRQRAGRRPGRAQAASEPEVVAQDLDVTFMTAVRGGTERLRLNIEGKSRAIDVTIPRGIANGAKLRVRGGDDIGDIILKIRVGKHPVFRRVEYPGAVMEEGLDLYLDLPLTIAEATLGADVAVPTLEAPVDLTVPPGSASGRKLRLRGKGVEDAKGIRGDLYVVLKIVPPDGKALTAEEAGQLRSIAQRFPSPRSGQEWPGNG